MREVANRLKGWRGRAFKSLHYCRFKESCPEKHIKKSQYTKGIYYLICDHYPELCTQQTTEPQKIVLEETTKK